MTCVIFMGTPNFSVPSLTVLADGDTDVIAVVTQPDRRKGRGRQLIPSPVKQFALEHNIPVLQPASLRKEEAQAQLAALQPDLIVVAAYGQILRPAILDLPPRGCINVHASLLPRWRGASPIQAAILAGDQVTGSTIMRMDVGMDTGPILAQAALAIAPDDTGETLTAKLARHGADLLARTLPRWLDGQIVPQAQDDRLATLCRPIKKEQGRIDWNRPAQEIARLVRAFNPWPAATSTWQGAPLKILQAAALPADAGPAGRPGQVVLTGDGQAAVICGEGLLRLDVVQLAGRRATPMADFLRGQRDFAGSRLGE